MRKLIPILFFVLALSLSVYAAGSINITSIAVSPTTVNPGATLAITANVNNTANTTLQSITFNTTDPALAGSPAFDIPNNVLSSNGALNPGLNAAPLSLPIPYNMPPGAYTATLTSVQTTNSTNTDSRAYTFSVASSPSLSVKLNSQTITDSLSINLESGESSDTLNLTLTNTGNVPLTNLRTSGVFLTLQDNDGDSIAITNPTTVSTLAVGQSVSAMFNFDVESGFDESTLEGTLKIESNEGVLMQIPFRLNVKPLACLPNSRSNNIGLDINHPDSNDQFGPGDTVGVDLSIDNNGHDNLHSRIQSVIYNLDRDRKIDSQTSSRTIGDGRTERVTFNLNLGTQNVRDNDNFVLFVKVFDNNDHLSCRLEQVDLDVRVPDHKITINNPTLSPTAVSCGSSVTGTALLRNVGDNDESVTFDVYNNQLGVSLASQTFRINQNTNENEQAVNFGFNTPQSATAGTYPITLKARYSGEETLSALNLQVQNCGATQTNQQTTQSQTSQQTSGTTGNVATTGTNNAAPITGSTIYTEKGLFDNFNTKLNVPASVWVLVDVLLVVLILACLVWLFRPR